MKNVFMDPAPKPKIVEIAEAIIKILTKGNKGGKI